jgi:hypothetical protein
MSAAVSSAKKAAGITSMAASPPMPELPDLQEPPHGEPPLTILYRDDYLVAVNKPSGPAGPSQRHRSARDALCGAVAARPDRAARVPAASARQADLRRAAVRLRRECAREVGGQFERDEIAKRYLAVVRGWPPDAGLIDHPLSRQFDDYGRKFVAGAGPTAAQPAVTEFRRLATVELPEAVDRYPGARYALLELRPHQRTPAPVAAPPEAHRPPHHRRCQLGQGRAQPVLPASLRLPPPAAGLHGTRLHPPCQRRAPHPARPPSAAISPPCCTGSAGPTRPRPDIPRVYARAAPIHPPIH